MTRGYETTNGRYVEVGDQTGRNRKRVRRCDQCHAELSWSSGQLVCTGCGRTAEQMGQLPA